MLASSSYLAILLAAVWLAAAPASMAVLPMCDSAKVSGTVTSQAIVLFLYHGSNVMPSGRFPFCRIKFAGSFVAGIMLPFHSSQQNIRATSEMPLITVVVFCLMVNKDFFSKRRSIGTKADRRRPFANMDKCEARSESDTDGDE